jgi:hypothetical protein
LEINKMGKERAGINTCPEEKRGKGDNKLKSAS